MSRVGRELSSVPFPDLISNLGLGIASAQLELDKNSTKVAQLMSGLDDNDRILFNGKRLSLIELGFTPTFYQFIESTIEVKIVVKMTESESSTEQTKRTSNETERRGWWFYSNKKVVSTTTVDANYAKKYDYSVEGSSLIRTKLVPVPPPAILEERIRILMEAEAENRAKLEAANG